MAVALLPGTSVVTVPARSQRIVALLTSKSALERSSWRLAFAVGVDGTCPSPLPPNPSVPEASIGNSERWAIAKRAPSQLAELFAPSSLCFRCDNSGTGKRQHNGVVRSSVIPNAGLGVAPR
uniref:Uncharacterized protein n=1 Tax=Tetraselmis chuii TaxID=63592 RepID=A0A7S1X6U6_9CHLO